jgi:hypothetical protein
MDVIIKTGEHMNDIKRDKMLCVDRMLSDLRNIVHAKINNNDISKFKSAKIILELSDHEDQLVDILELTNEVDS